MCEKKYILWVAVCAVFMLLIPRMEGQSKQVVACGSIVYERKISLKKKITESREEEDDGFWMEEMIKRAPANVTDIFTMHFNERESLYAFDKKKDNAQFRMWGSDDVGMRNVVYKNLITGERTSMKQLYETDFILLDTVKKFEWKLTREFRDIAGYECRKATTIINDSLYVIAFYTDDIVCSSGPEGFSGLPGTILGLVMPRLYTTWFATSVTPFCDEKYVIERPSKGKKSTFVALESQLADRYAKYKKWYQSMVWNLVI